MQITVASRDTGASAAFNNVVLDGDSLGDFNLTGFNDRMVEGAQLDDGFTLTGDIVLSGFFSTSQERSRVEVKVGHNAAPLLYVEDDAAVYLHGRDSFAVPVQFDPNGHALSSVAFTLDYDPSCLTFDSVTDAEPLGSPDGVPDAVGDVPVVNNKAFEVTVDHQDDDITLLVKSPLVDPSNPLSNPLLVLEEGVLLSLEFGLTGSNKCPNTQGQTKAVDFEFLTRNSPAVPTFGNDQGQNVPGGAEDGTYTLFFNATPTDLTLNGDNVDENEPISTEVGTLSTEDPDLLLVPSAGEVHTYSLETTCNNHSGNGAFQITGDKLQTAMPLDFEVDSFFDVCVRTTDAWGLFRDEQFRISVNDVNETPSDIQLDDNVVAENLMAPAPVGMLSTTDEDAGDSHAYSWCADPPVEPGLPFEIAGDLIQTTESLNHEVRAAYNVCVSSTDSGGLSVDRLFTLAVLDANDPPVAVDDGVAPVTAAAISPEADGTWLPIILVAEIWHEIDVLANDTDEDSHDSRSRGSRPTQPTATHAGVRQPGCGVHGERQLQRSRPVRLHRQGCPAAGERFQFRPSPTRPRSTSTWWPTTTGPTATPTAAWMRPTSRHGAGDLRRTRRAYRLVADLSWATSRAAPRAVIPTARENGLDGTAESVDAADIICTVLIFFDQGCEGAQAASVEGTAGLQVADNLSAAPGQTVAVPLLLETGGANAAALTFALEYDAESLSFDASDDDGDGVPDAIVVAIPAAWCIRCWPRRAASRWRSTGSRCPCRCWPTVKSPPSSWRWPRAQRARLDSRCNA